MGLISVWALDLTPPYSGGPFNHGTTSTCLRVGSRLDCEMKCRILLSRHRRDSVGCHVLFIEIIGRRDFDLIGGCLTGPLYGERDPSPQ